MDKKTLIYLINSMKSFTIFLTNFLKGTSEKSDYILDKNHSKISTFMISNIIFLSIKEDLISGVTNNYEIITLRKNLIDSLKYICSTNNTLDKTHFNDPADILGTIRNKIAHGNFIINDDNTFSIFKENDEIKINMDDYIKFINRVLKLFYERIKGSIYQKTVAVGKTNNLNTKGEILSFLRKSKVYNFKLKRINGNIDPLALNNTKKIINEFLETNDLKILLDYQSAIRDEYIFTWDTLKKHDETLNEIAKKCYETLPKDMECEKKAEFIHEFLLKECYKETKFNLVISLFKNLILLQSLSEVQECSKDNITKWISTNYGELLIDISEVATSSITLFNAIFSYANEYLLDFPFEKLNLSSLDISFYKHINKEKNELIIMLKSKLREIEKITNRINLDTQNLENVKSSNNQSAISIISNKISTGIKIKYALQQDIHTLCEKIGKIVVNEDVNQEYIKSKDIINGIRNSIAHGHVYIIDDNIYFNDIFENNLTFACKVNIIDFLNMLYENISVLDEYLNKYSIKKLKKE